MNVAEWLARAARQDPHQPALFTGASIVADYAKFAGSAARLANALSKRWRISPGDRVALFMANRVEYLELLYAVWWLGGAVVPINYRLHPKEIAWIVENSGARLVLADDKGAGSLAAELKGGGDTEIVSLDDAAFQRMRQADALAGPAAREAGDLAWLFYTSGTTGKPKGVMISHGNIQAMTFAYFVDVDEVRARDATLYAAPLSHGAGLYNFMHVLRGARHVVPESQGFDPAEILALAKAHGDVAMFAAPTMVRRLLDSAKKAGSSGDGLRTIVYGGGPMYVADIIEAVDVLGPRFVQIYGQGESPMCITALSRAAVADRSHPRWRERIGSVGVAQSCVEVRIADPEGRALPTNETGEILVRGTPVMLGYWRNPDATAATLRDGWLWTGDVGALDQDGYLTLKDRSKDVIISGGTNIYPREVEEPLLLHPDVHEVSVVGKPSLEWGEEVVAFIVARPGATADAAALDRHCLGHIARFKRPRDYVFVSELPKNNYGKVLKTELRERLAQADSRE
jgi:acyl-CoA synthetase (AMP-forming)/AMP-acid ligase II